MVLASGSDVYISGPFTGVYNVAGGSVVSIGQLAVWNEKIGWRDIAGPSAILGSYVSAMASAYEYIVIGGDFNGAFEDFDDYRSIAGIKDSGLSYSDVNILGSYINPENSLKIILGPPGSSAQLVWNSDASKWCVI